MSESFDIRTTPSLAKYVMYLIHQDVDTHEEISQSKAYSRFGRSNVIRWVKESKVKKYLRGEHSIKYKLHELLKISAKEQDI
jgi:hypothetical protein